MVDQRPKLRLSTEELLRHLSGILIIRLWDAEMPEPRTVLEIFLDEYTYPAYMPYKVNGEFHRVERIGDFVIREIDFSRITFKARKSTDKTDEVLASTSGNTIDILKQCLVSGILGLFLRCRWLTRFYHRITRQP